ncbi:MAG: hypothetical protein H0W36_11295 [Gemmatimonadetes bacterium]|nr:hypothetical protein [Gemmatimonadota bacterium]
MKPLFALLVLVMSMSAPALAQPRADESLAAVASPDSKEAFDKLKTLAGSWVGQLTTFPREPAVDGNFAQISMRVTSLGNALVHEMSISGRPDHPLTMFHLEDDRFVATHYCDAGNRPRMVGTVSPDGTTVEFQFLDLSGQNQYGHMHGVLFTFIDENHHTQDWTWMQPDDKPVRVHFDLQRTNAGGGFSGT